MTFLATFTNRFFLVFHYINESCVILFGLAFVLTRPFGETLGDLLAKTHEKGGLNFGTIGSTSILYTLIAVIVVTEIINKNRETRSAC